MEHVKSFIAINDGVFVIYLDDVEDLIFAFLELMEFQGLIVVVLDG